ncbi:MAG: ABC transporter substrate-binding protein [Anaerolineae bacterium]|jgi:peptide/nickel transport system substrate-binding protein|nr:ABC transporter substrate-binding protein [Anaerolineae bacterium]
MALKRYLRISAVLLVIVLTTVLSLRPLSAQDEVTEFVFAHPGPIRTMDAPVTWFGSTHWLTNLLYDCLIWRAADGNGYVGQAAERWENIDDLTWRFYLREGLTFQNGEVLDAEAVKWNIDRVRSREDFLVYPQWQFVADVVVVDALTVDVITKTPYPYFEYDISFNGCQILPPDYLEEVGEEEFARSPVGSGPYRLVEFTESDRYVFEAWDGYWGGRPEVDRVIYQVIPEQSAQVAALLAGQVDLIPTVPVPDRERLGATDGLSLVTETSNRMHHLYLRVETETGAMNETYPDYQPATLDNNVRLAISHALDRSLLAEVQGSASPRLLRVCSYYPEGAIEAYSDPAAVADWYDPELARSLLIEAGFDLDAGAGPTVYLDAPVFQFGGEKEVAEIAAAMLEEVGFNVELNVMDSAAYSEQITSGGNNRDIMLTTLGCAPSLVPSFYQCEWTQANYNVCVPEWDAIGEQITQTVDPAARLALWEQWWEYYVNYAQTITLYEIDNVMAYNSAEFEFTPRKDGWFTFRDLKVRQ